MVKRLSKAFFVNYLIFGMCLFQIWFLSWPHTWDLSDFEYICLWVFIAPEISSHHHSETPLHCSKHRCGYFFSIFFLIRSTVSKNIAPNGQRPEFGFVKKGGLEDPCLLAQFQQTQWCHFSIWGYKKKKKGPDALWMIHWKKKLLFPQEHS